MSIVSTGVGDHPGIRCTRSFSPFVLPGMIRFLRIYEGRALRSSRPRREGENTALYFVHAARPHAAARRVPLLPHARIVAARSGVCQRAFTSLSDLTVQRRVSSLCSALRALCDVKTHTAQPPTVSGGARGVQQPRFFLFAKCLYSVRCVRVSTYTNSCKRAA